MSRTLVALLSSFLISVIPATTLAKSTLGEQPSPDITGTEGGRKGAVNDGPRGPKGNVGSPKVSAGADGKTGSGSSSKVPPVPNIPVIDFKPLIDALKAVNASRLPVAPERSGIDKWVAGIDVLVKNIDYWTNLDRIDSYNKQRDQIALTEKPGASFVIQVVMTPSGKVSVTKVSSIDTPPPFMEAGSRWLNQSISNPEFVSTTPPLTEAQQREELRHFYEQLSPELRQKFAARFAQLQAESAAREARAKEHNKVNRPARCTGKSCGGRPDQ